MQLKPILLGMNNPLSRDPGHALYPLPVGCTGNRVWRMLNARTGATRGEYLEAFERRNLVPHAVWTQAEARSRASAFVEEARGRTVVVFGADPRDALGLPKVLIKPVEKHGVVWRLAPHPSGRNLWYNVPGNRESVELLLEELYRQTALGPQQGALL